jgi:hypothetical protein
MYYRRKILLALLQIFDNNLNKIDLQKLLFLICDLQKKSSYYFVPYKFGCFSFHAQADLRTLSKYKLVEEFGKNWQKCNNEDYISMLEVKDREILRFVKGRYEKILGKKLIKHTYTKYPYYAINSTIAQKILTEEEFKQIEDIRPINNETALFTIGYEGISLEEYINKLIKYDINLLCDVRNNPLSMKYGFSKSQLKKVCENVGIGYIHLPEAGIKSEFRKDLKSQIDYDILFKRYKNDLKNKEDLQQQIFNFLLSYKRIALTCFEANICQCHRLHLAESITKLKNWDYKLKHI